MPDVTQTAAHWSDLVITFAATYGLSLAGGLLILAVGWKVAGWAHRIVDRVLSRARKLDATLRHFLASLVRYAILGFTLMAALDRVGIQTASLIAMLGAAGLAIGLALQGTLSNLAAGVMLMLFRPFKVGDHVSVAGHTGTVRAIDLFVTELASEDHVQVLLPNTKVWGDAIINRSHYATRLVEVSIPVTSTDIDRAIEVAEKAITGDRRFLPEPKPEVVTSEVAGKSVTILVQAWCRNEDYARARGDAIRSLRTAFDAAGL